MWSPMGCAKTDARGITVAGMPEPLSAASQNDQPLDHPTSREASDDPDPARGTDACPDDLEEDGYGHGV